jgi:hypothetical protein
VVRSFLLCQGAVRGDLPSACPRLCSGPLRAGWAVAVLQFELEGATTAGLAGVAVDDLMGPTGLSSWPCHGRGASARSCQQGQRRHDKRPSNAASKAPANSSAPPLFRTPR